MKKMSVFFLVIFTFLFSCSEREESPSDSSQGDVALQDIVQDDAGVKPKYSRLTSNGKRIVDAEGNPVRLRGFNIGGYLFLETWVNQIDYTTSSRAYKFAQNHKYKDEIITALKESLPEAKKGDPLPNVCIANSPCLLY
ncbi:MAG: hypothetical protein N3B13_11305, partial [Deltaproteobacteria bacterium]|nr:hypothetical protein [Deltaproteobacteria bacterium]